MIESAENWKLMMISQIIEAKRSKLPTPPPPDWYGDLFDKLYDTPTSTLASTIRINNWVKQD